mmetsp:Transcript_13606/g.29140  ORF Transcript_13606/g.29140 Transcript_13606/m.29140 type:complete len:223 (+) Transcript_13606:742-1410(+)
MHIPSTSSLLRGSCTCSCAALWGGGPLRDHPYSGWHGSGWLGLWRCGWCLEAPGCRPVQHLLQQLQVTRLLGEHMPELVHQLQSLVRRRGLGVELLGAVTVAHGVALAVVHHKGELNGVQVPHQPGRHAQVLGRIPGPGHAVVVVGVFFKGLLHIWELGVLLGLGALQRGCHAADQGGQGLEVGIEALGGKLLQGQHGGHEDDTVQLHIRLEGSEDGRAATQ